MPTGKTPIIQLEIKWKIVYFILKRKAHYYKDNCFDDGTTSLFAVFDGHGGTDVVDYITRILPEVIDNIYIYRHFLRISNSSIIKNRTNILNRYSKELMIN